MMSSNGNIFRVTGLLCGEFTPVNSLHKGQWCGTLMFSFICSWINGWVNNRDAGDLRRHRAHYDVIVMNQTAPDHIVSLWSGGLCISDANHYLVSSTQTGLVMNRKLPHWFSLIQVCGQVQVNSLTNASHMANEGTGFIWSRWPDMQTGFLYM